MSEKRFIPIGRGRNIGGQRYLFLAAFLILISFCGYFYFALSNMSDTLLKEKIIDRRFDVNTVCNEIDCFIELDKNGDTHDYRRMLAYVVSRIDATVGTYCELFDEDFNSLSERSPLFTGAPFDPREYAELVQAIRANERGEMTVWFDKEDTKPHDLHLCYRWVPTDKTLKNRMLIIVGVSKYSVDTNIGVWISCGAMALIIVSAIVIVAAVVLLCRNVRRHGKGAGDGGE